MPSENFYESMDETTKWITLQIKFICSDSENKRLMFAFSFLFMKGSAIADIIIINQLFVEWMIINDTRPKIKMGSKKIRLL